MDEQTTTAPDTSESSEQPSQLGEAVQAADEQTTETQPDPTSTPESTEHTEDDDVAWLRNKGVDPTDPAALKNAAKFARDAEREFHKSRQEAKNQLRDEITTAYAPDEADTEYDPVMARLQALESRDQQREASLRVIDFYDAHPDARDLDSDMADIVKAKPYLAQDLDALYTIAKASKSDAAITAAEERGRETERQAIGRASSAHLPAGNASSPSSTSQKLSREVIANMGQEEYVTRRSEINAWLQSGS